jgi:hypothetical protein
VLGPNLTLWVDGVKRFLWGFIRRKSYGACAARESRCACGPAEVDLTGVELIAQEIGERSSGEADAANGPPSERGSTLLTLGVTNAVAGASGSSGDPVAWPPPDLPITQNKFTN